MVSLTYYNIPTRRYTVTHGATVTDIQDCTMSCQVTSKENAVDVAQLRVADQFADLYGNTVNENRTKGWTETGSPDWDVIDSISFQSETDFLNTGHVWVDGLYMDGWIVRVAKQAGGYSAADPLRAMFINDDIAKDDSGIDTDTTGTIAQLCYAEYLRKRSAPIQGTVSIPSLMPDALAGQIVHIHAAKTLVTSRIDLDFRVQQLDRMLSEKGDICYLTLTSDLINANALPPKDSYNALIDAIKPEFKDRQSSSAKARDVDVTQMRMEKEY